MAQDRPRQHNLVAYLPFGLSLKGFFYFSGRGDTLLLAMDIGNTNIKLGLFQGNELQATWRVHTNVHKTSDDYASIFMNLFASRELSLPMVKSAIISSVVPPLTATLQEVCQGYFGVDPLIVAAGIKTSLRISVENPKAVGSDRIANAHAAYDLYGGPVIVIGFGTATIFDVVTADGTYLGGAIAPGIGISSEAMVTHSASLPLVDFVPPRQIIGKNTIAAMHSGLVYGYVGLVEGIVDRIQREIKSKAKVVATGGWAEIIAKETKIIEVVNQQITLEGLRVIHDLNS